MHNRAMFATAPQVCFDSFAAGFNYLTNGELNFPDDTPAQEVINAYEQWRLEQQPEATAEILPLPAQE